MTGTEAEAAARLLERLVSDPGYRERFRRNPVAASRQAGLASVAEEMAMGGGKALDTLEGRESRSSLAGLFMAAALEGAALYDFSEEVLPHLDDVPESVGKVLSRVHLGGIAEAQAATPAAPGVEQISAKAGVASAAVAQPDAVAGEFRAITPEQAAAARALASSDSPASPVSSASSDSSDAPDPAQYGQDGTGGAPTPEAVELLQNKRVTLDAGGIADLKGGKVDPRIVSVLSSIAKNHTLSVSVISSGHDKQTSGGSISNHYYGRGVDISMIDGQPVNPGNTAARKVAEELSSLPASIRPSEVGSPWALPGTAGASRPGGRA